MSQASCRRQAMNGRQPWSRGALAQQRGELGLRQRDVLGQLRGELGLRRDVELHDGLGRLRDELGLRQHGGLERDDVLL